MIPKRKREILSRIPEDLLIEIHVRSRRKSSFKVRGLRGDALLDFLSRQYSYIETLRILRLYASLGRKPAEIALEITRPNGARLVNDLAFHFPSSYERRTELRVNKSPCDLCLVDKRRRRVWAFEAKANGDKIQRALRQCNDYLLWADFVGICIEGATNHLRGSFSKKIGLYSWTDGNIRQLRKPGQNPPRKSIRLLFLSKKKLQEIARLHNVSPYQPKDRLVRRLSQKLDEKEIATYFLQSLVS